MRLDLSKLSGLHVRCANWRTVIALAIAGVLSGGATAQVLIQPVVVELSQQRRVASVTLSLSSKARAPVRLQADVLSWRQDLLGRPVSEYTDDLLVTPPLVVIQPGERQVFRVALRKISPSTDELSYRLLLEDISDQVDQDQAPGVNVRFRMNYDLPVLVAPIGKVVERVRWKLCDAPDHPVAPQSSSLNTPPGPTCLRVLNDGSRRLKIRNLTLVSSDGTEVIALKEAETLLAGTVREWRIPSPPSRTRMLQGVLLESDRGHTLKAEDGGF